MTEEQQPSQWLCEAVQHLQVPLADVLARGFSVGEVVAAYRAMMAGRTTAKQTTELEEADYKALYESGCKGDVSELRRLLLGAVYDDVDKYKNEHGYTALAHASICEDATAMSLLITAGADVNYDGGVGGTTPLMFAAMNGNALGVELLLMAGAIVDKKSTHNGWTALLWTKSFSVASLLIHAGADINLRRQGGFTPLMDTARHGMTPTLMRTLLYFGADINALDDEGKSVYDHAPFGLRLQMLLRAPLYRSALAVRRLLVSADSDSVWEELYELWAQDMAMLVYCNPAATVRLQELNPTVTGSESQSVLQFHVSKESLSHVLRSVRKSLIYCAETATMISAILPVTPEQTEALSEGLTSLVMYELAKASMA